MKLNELIEKSYQTFQDHVGDAQVILLHPNSRYRSVLVAKLIHEPQMKTYYYALGPGDINLETFISSITHDLATQHPTFGRHINMVSSEVYDESNEDYGEILEMFHKDLAELSDEPYLLILDEYDRSDGADDIQRFVELLADHLPPNCRLVINTRTLPRISWLSLVAKNEAILLLDDQMIQRNLYDLREGEDYQLEVFALGPGYVLLDGETIDTWEGHLPRLLFFFSLDRPVVTRSEICKAFWPELESDQAVNVFHVTKRRLHKALGRDALVHKGSYYTINPELTLYYDVMDFVETLVEGRDASNQNPFESWQRAAKLYRGPFLQGHEDEWIDDRRVAFRAGYLEALTQMAQIWVDKGRDELALKLYRSAIDEDYTREDLHRRLMQLYANLGRRSEAVAHYQQLEKYMEDRSNQLSAETQTLYSEIMA